MVKLVAQFYDNTNKNLWLDKETLHLHVKFHLKALTYFVLSLLAFSIYMAIVQRWLSKGQKPTSKLHKKVKLNNIWKKLEYHITFVCDNNPIMSIEMYSRFAAQGRNFNINRYTQLLVPFVPMVKSMKMLLCRNWPNQLHWSILT